MKAFKTIKNFYFGKARYHLADSDGNSLLMIIDYKNNKYDLVSNSINKKLKIEARRVALDLLKRKSGVNFAKIR